MMRVRKYDNVISIELRDVISYRYKRITRAINREFWKTESETSNSIFVGSYGRNTAISTSDIDILVKLPKEEFDRFNSLSGNSQSRLLQAVRNAIKDSYPNSEIRADGQIVKVLFSDGIKFEVLPAFKNWNDNYIYPDTNMGGNWLSTNPTAEQNAMKEKNNSSNGLLIATCRHIRFIRDNYFKSYKLSGIVIDSFVYHAMGDWRFVNSGENSSEPGAYERVLLEYFNKNKHYWKFIKIKAPGSCDEVDCEHSIDCLEKILNFMVNL